MRRIDENPIDPEVAAELDAIDATLAGEPVDPRHAELAELALLLVAERPRPEPRFEASLDEQVARRFAGGSDGSGVRSGGWLAGWFAPLAGLATAAVAAIVAIVVLGSHGAGPTSGQSAGMRTARTPTAAASSSGAASSASGGQTLTPFAASAPAPQPQPNGRKVIQGAQLALAASASRIDTVAQEIFDVVGRQHGVVNNSQVTSGQNGSAEFQLSVPSSGLGQTMTALSELRYASVTSRTDSTQDVNDQYLADQRRLADARALRTSLLKQLAAATTQQQIESLKAQIRDAEASIRSDEATLRGLDHQVGFSQIYLTINAAPPVLAPRANSGSFGIGKAFHDAGRVLDVAAGVALITLAALTPLILIGLLGWWIAATVRRRRREQALDVA